MAAACGLLCVAPLLCAAVWWRQRSVAEFNRFSAMFPVALLGQVPSATDDRLAVPQRRRARSAVPVPSLSRCANALLQACAMERYTASRSPLLSVDHVYVLHYTRNAQRRAFQLEQLPRLGINFSLVSGLDREAIDRRVRACLLTKSPAENLDLEQPEGDSGSWTLNMHAHNKSAYVSQVAKLLAALRGMLHARHRHALVLEDDASVRWSAISLLQHALSALAGNFSIVYAGSYTPDRTDDLFNRDPLPTGLYLKDSQHVPPSRGGGRMMAATGSVLSAAGAAHVLAHAIPIRGSLDLMMSDWRLPSAPQEKAYVFKPFTFRPRQQLQQEGLPGEAKRQARERDRRQRDEHALARHGGGTTAALTPHIRSAGS